jgi:general stress protein 26
MHPPSHPTNQEAAVSDETTDTTETRSDEKAARHVAELVDRARLCMLTTMTPDGRHVSRPMAVQDVEFDGDLWFFTYEDSDKVKDVTANPQVNVAFSNDQQSEWTSISGSATVVYDRAKAEELYNPALKVWFPDGVDTPGLALLRVRAESAEYWDSPSSNVRKLVGALRAVLRKDPEEFPGENREVAL